ncbi:MAG: hypothetical protein EBS00_00950, partial [Verrucomicrobia bacterium]|nr:hypothetical protein [Verrucomicrobiota bacterium]
MKHITSITTLTLVAASAFADAAPAAAPASAWSQSANIALTSNYVWRGVSQNSNSIAVQGGFDVAHSSGLSAGVWASSLSSGTELDLYANYGFKVGSVDLSVGYIAYTYQSNVASTFSEVNVAASYAGLTAKVSKEVQNAKGSQGNSDYGYYYELGYTYSIPSIKGLDLGLHYGWTDSNISNKTIEDYSVGLSYPVAGCVASVVYSNGNSTIDGLTA